MPPGEERGRKAGNTDPELPLHLLACREIKAELQPMEEEVCGFRVFADNASIYAAYILATLEWGCMYCHYEGRDSVPILPEWLTTFIGGTKDSTTNADVPRKCVQVGHSDIQLNFVVTWQWMADLLQFWMDLSEPRLYSGIFQYLSTLVQRLMADINSGLTLPIMSPGRGSSIICMAGSVPEHCSTGCNKQSSRGSKIDMAF